MSSRFLTSLCFLGALSLAPVASAQDAGPSPEVEAAPVVEIASHALQEAPDEPFAAVESRPAVAEQRSRGGAGRADDGDNRQRGGQREGRVERRPAPRVRSERPVARGDRDDRRRTDDRRRAVVVRPRVVYSPRVVYRREPHRYAYAGPYLPSRRVFGLGIYYGPSFGGYYRDPYYYRSRVDYGYRPDYDYDIGELRLQVSPRRAQVFVDGDYAGTVDDFDGAFQSLKLESGAYTIRLESPGYEPMEFDVRITPGRKITYREDLRRE